jgi:ATP-binding cassette subfamily B protein
MLESLGLLVQNGLGFGALAGILWTYAGWLPLVLVLTGVPGLLLVARHILREHQWNLAHTTLERRSRYLDWLITERSAAAEMRLFDLGHHHRKAFERLRGTLREGRLRLARQGAAADLGAGLLAWGGSLAGLGWMLHRTLSHNVGLGDLLLCFQAFQQGQTLLRALLEGAGRVYRSLLFVSNLDEFLALEPQMVSGSGGGAGLPVRDRIRFDLDLPVGKVVALVGPNGAGKSTLIKLLCRFYDPNAGRILLDQVDLRTLDPAALRRQITVLFQDPVHYHASVAENIAFGDLEGLNDPERIRAAARDAGALEPIDRLPGGLETLLGKWFGGAELSGGEWQRIALARAFFRKANLVILDEPTSAQDSWAEQDWLGRFRTLTQGRTALMITHRFTTAMHADLIHVLDRGRIVESGTHDELVRAAGAYARSWAAQMREIGHGHV